MHYLLEHKKLHKIVDYNEKYYESMFRNLINLNKDFERKYDQQIDNIETAQRTIIEKVAGIRSLIELNYKEIKKNRDEILENRKVLLNRMDDLEEKITRLIQER